MVMGIAIVFIAQKCLGVPTPVEVFLAGREINLAARKSSRADSKHGQEQAKEVELTDIYSGTAV